MAQATVEKTTRRTTSKRTSKSKAKAPGLSRIDMVAIAVAGLAALSTVVLSMAMNVEAFTKTTDNVWARGVGIALPLWVLAMTFIAAHMHGRNWWAMVGAYGLAGFALIVSMPHLVAGFQAWGLHGYEAWSLAIVTDLLQVIAKVAIITMVQGKVVERPQWMSR